MILAGVHSGDLLVVDRSLEAKNGSVVLAILDGDFTVKRLRKNRNKFWLEPANRHFQPIEIAPETDFEIWGVVTSSIHSTL